MSASKPTPKRLLFLGHSHVKHLSTFISRKSGYLNFGIAEEDLKVKFIGRSGGKSPHLLSSNVMSEIFSFSPGTIVIAIGDNEILVSSSVEEIASKLVAAATVLKRLCPSVNNIIFSQLLPRYVGARGDIDHYNLVAGQVNRFLSEEVQHYEYLDFFHSNFCFPTNPSDSALTTLKSALTQAAEVFPPLPESPRPSSYSIQAKYFKRDGVHLKPNGNYQLYKSLRHIALKTAYN